MFPAIKEMTRRVSVALAASTVIFACHQTSLNEHSSQDSDLEEWTVVEELRIGTLEGQGPDQFGHIAWLDLDSSGYVYALDHQAQEIRVFDQGGQHVRTIGQRGEGPGEFLGAAGFSFGPSGSISVWDPLNQRITSFSASGELLGTTPRRTRGLLTPWRGGFTIDGRFIEWGYDYRGPTTSTVATHFYYAIAVSLKDGSVDTLGTFLGEEERGTGMIMPFSRRPTLHLSGFDDVWISSPADFTLHRLSLRGDSIQRISLSGAPVPVSKQELDSVRASIRRRPELTVDWDAVATTKQVVHRVFDDGEDYVYVLPDLVDDAVGYRADVIDAAKGQHVAFLRFPERIVHSYPPPAVEGDRILAVVKDNYGVEYVVRYRIVRGAS